MEALSALPEGAVLILSAHGVSRAVRQKASRRRLKVIDATCPLVTKVHLEAVRMARESDTIFLIGQRGVRGQSRHGVRGRGGDRFLLTPPARLYTVYNMNLTPIPRRTLVDEACARLRDEIIGRRLGGGQRVTETELAARLGISRTPLRAALSRLAHEGFVEIDPGRGVRVAPDGADVVREVYPILAALDGAALEQAMNAGACDAARLADIHARLTPGLTRARLFSLDHEFHAALRTGCPNRRLLDLIERHLLLAARFDGAAARGMHAVEKSRAEHADILAAVTRGRAVEARARLEAHWLGGIEVVVDWLAKDAEAARKSRGR